jgi:hypothetical protein
MDKDFLISELKPKVSKALSEFRLFLEDAVSDGWLPGKVLSFFDDSVMMHKEEEQFILAGDGIGSVMSEIRKYCDDAPATVDIQNRIEQLDEIQTNMYVIGENLSPV